MAEMDSFPADENEQTVQDVISKLGFIATVRPNEKIDIATLSIQPDSILSRAYRTLIARNESRDATLRFLRHILDEAFNLANMYLNRDSQFDRTIGQMIVEKLVSSKRGIESLKETYKDDRMFVSRITTLIETLNAKIINLPQEPKL